jgi:hypothetical protein
MPVAVVPALLSLKQRAATTLLLKQLLRHKTMDTTLRVYKKQITPQGLLAGMQQFQKTLGK